MSDAVVIAIASLIGVLVGHLSKGLSERGTAHLNTKVRMMELDIEKQNSGIAAQNAVIEMLQKQLAYWSEKYGLLLAEKENAEDFIDILNTYIDELIIHINRQLPPPPPERPERKEIKIVTNPIVVKPPQI